jgi:transcription initiation factor TFIIIB Brf1 subunit/transcription initiation factor TFIIB
MKQAWLLNKTLKAKKEQVKIQRITAVDYLHEFAGKITANKELILSAENTLLKIKRSGGNPVGLAAGAFYNACKKNKAKISKEKIGKTFHISPRTVYTNEVKIRKLKTATAIASLTPLITCPQAETLTKFY